MTDEEAAAIRAKSEKTGVPVARLVRRCVFGLQHELDFQINPGNVSKPTVSEAAWKVG
jgi:hypothetical protein